MISALVFGADRDFDGLPDRWEQENGRDPFVADYQISAGTYHTCALDDEGAVCWGLNQYGQAAVPSLIEVKQISAGGGHSCAIDQNGAICWGYNEYGQRDVPSNIGNIVGISAGFDHSCALTQNRIRCWGYNEYGQSRPPTSLTSPIAVSAGFDHTCAIDGTGVVCWGYNGYGQTDPPLLIAPSRIASGFNHSCAIDESGVKCWGDDQYGQSTPPSLLSPLQVATGFDHSCAIDDTGVVCWGNDTFGQSTAPELVNPVQVEAGFDYSCALDLIGVVCCGDVDDVGSSSIPTMENPQTVSLGFEHSCASYPSTIICWGNDDSGQSSIPPLEKPKAVSNGFEHTCAITDTGAVCWGYDEFGQSTVPNLDRVESISAGGDHSCAIDKTGVVCWGFNESGQASSPPLSEPSQVSAGFDHTCALSAAGIDCWGDDQYGQASVPMLVAPTYVDSGFNHTCAIDSGMVKCWGDSQFGQTSVPQLSGPTQVSAGYDHSCAIDETGVVCWGDDQYGQSSALELNNPSYVSAGFYNTCVVDDDGLKCWGSDYSDGLIAPALMIDPDGDSYQGLEDEFPLDASEWLDSDQDGVGDNLDVFPNNATEALDSDYDGIGDNSDFLPFDDSESVDTDNDGVGNNEDPDDDNDNVSDLQEADDGTNPLDPLDCAGCPPGVSGSSYHWASHSLLESVIYELEPIGEDYGGGESVTALSDEQGDFLFESKYGGANRLTASRIITDRESGSVISSADALAALKIAVGINPNPDPDGSGSLESIPVSPYQYIAADINSDGRVTSSDALAILKMAVNLDTAPLRRWVFVSEDFDFWNESARSFTTTQSDVRWDRGGIVFEYPAVTTRNLVGVLMGDVNGSWNPPAGSSILDESYFKILTDIQGGSPAQWGIRNDSSNHFSEDDSSTSSQPNILLIISDDQGTDASAQYSSSSDLPVTPRLNQLAAEGIIFDNVWATPACTTTRAAIITGKYGINSGVTSNDDVIADDEITIHRYLSEAENSSNYGSAIIGKWGLGGGNASNDHPLLMGVEYFAGSLRRAISNYFQWDLTINGTTTISEIYNTTKLTDLAIEWIDGQEKPWFLWLAYTAPHDPYHLPPSTLHNRELSGEESDITANSRPYYLASIEAMDSEIGRLVDSIGRSTLENTIILYVGDNGTPNNVIDPAVFANGKSSVSEGGIRVPMIVSGASILRKDSRDGSLINVTDIFATVSELAGNDKTKILDSISFSSLLNNENVGERDYNYVDFERNGVLRWTIRDDRYKLIVNANGNQRLYDLLDDPYERSALERSSDQYSQIVSRLLLEGNLIRGSVNNGGHSADSAINITDAVFSKRSADCADYVNNYRSGVRDIKRVLDFEGNVEITSDETSCFIASNNIPNHDFNDSTARFATNASKQSRTFSIDRSPSFANQTTALGQRRYDGITLGGVVFDLQSNGCYQPDANRTDGDGNTENGQCANAAWKLNPLEYSTKFGADLHNAHVQPDGTYHYHGNPKTLFDDSPSGDGSPVIGFAADSFPIYGPYIYDEATGAYRKVVSGYTLKSNSRGIRTDTNPGGSHTGIYEADWEWTDAGDLDKCNGMTYKGQYGYYVTDEFPYILNCFIGTPASSFTK